MSRRKQLKRMRESLPSAVVNTIPEDKLNDRELLIDIFLYREKHINEPRTVKNKMTREFNKEHNTKGIKPLLHWSRKQSKTEIIRKAEKRKVKLNQNLIEELMKIINCRFPELQEKFGIVKDVRQKGKVTYSIKLIVLVRLLALVCGVKTMREINEKFNTEEAIENVKLITGEDIESIPDWQTIQDVLETMDIQDIIDIKDYMIQCIIDSKIFDKYKYRKCFQLLVDATGISNHDYNLNGNCIYKEHKSGKISYFKYVLEAKLVFGNIVISFDTEWIENSKFNNENDKQDCEVKAFKRMAERIHKKHPRLPLLVTGDALYGAESIIKLCNGYHWKYIFNLKPKRLKNVSNQLEEGNNCVSLPNYKVVKKVKHKEELVTALSYTEVNSKGEQIVFRYITNLNVNNETVSDVVELGRRRWKIENECFNMQKNGQYNISHLCSYNDNAMKIHYQFIQIAHLLRQLLELGSIVVKGMMFETKREITDFLRDSLTKKIISNLDDMYQKIQLRFDM